MGAVLGGLLASSFLLAAGAAFAAVLTFWAVTSKTARGDFLVRRGPDGRIDMQRTSKWRTNMGIALLGLAAVVAFIGYAKISLETLVAAQVVYLASAGFAVVILASAGGALLVSEQLRADESRIHELEEALATLGQRLAPDVAEPPRLLDRS